LRPDPEFANPSPLLTLAKETDQLMRSNAFAMPPERDMAKSRSSPWMGFKFETRPRISDTCFDGETLVHIRLNEDTIKLMGNFIKTNADRSTYIGVPLQCEIWHLKPGVEVLSKCERTGEVSHRKIIKTYEHSSQRIWDLSYYSERFNGYLSILVTDNHPFWVVGKGWVNVVDLRCGDEFATADGGRASFVSLSDCEYPGTVYNIEVEEFHTYFVGAGILVHNKNQEISVRALNESEVPGAVALLHKSVSC